MGPSRMAAPVLVMMGLAFPVQAIAAPEVRLDRRCYSPGEAITQTGSGFTPGAEVVESLTLVDPRTGQLLWRGFADPVTADGQGAITNRIAAPRLARRRDRREAAFSSFTDQADPENKVAFVQWILSDWSIRIRAWARGNGKARGAMVIDTYGWTSEGPSLYAHYYRGRALIKDVKVGALGGPCGDLRKRVRQFPFRGVRPGRWTVYFSATRRLNRRNDAFFFFRLRVRP
jgi:hypothetical protein